MITLTKSNKNMLCMVMVGFVEKLLNQEAGALGSP
jgi:hypothetical protein